MDEKHFEKSSLSLDAFPTHCKNPFLKLSQKQKYVIVYSTLTFLVLLALICSAMAFLSFDTKAGFNPSEMPTPSSENNDFAVTAPISPHVTVRYHGKILGTFKGDGVSVGTVIEHFGITLSENDTVNHPLDSEIWYGMEIFIDEITYAETFVTKEIPYETVEIPSQNIPRGERCVSVEGQTGQVGQVIRTKYVNGVETDAETTVEDVYVPVINEEILVGSGGTFTAPDGQEYSYSYYLDVVATAYTHTGNLTYSGTVAQVGVIAVDPNYIDLGSNVYVIGNYGDYGVCRAEDIGGGIKRCRIDVFLDTEEECVIFGRRNMRCYILD